MTQTDQIREKAIALGFDAIGFAPARLGPEARTRLRDFLAAGHHGSMGWLAERAEQRSHPQALWPEARSVISLGLCYAPPDDPMATVARKDRGNISVYARNRDYHDLVKGMLKHLAQFIVSRYGPEVKVFVDTAPVMEKPLAQQAGIGWQGKHTNLVSRAHGSLAVSRRNLHHPRLAARPAARRPLRQLHALPHRLPDQRLPRPIPAGCHPLHLLPHHRACRPDPHRLAPSDRQPHLWLR